MRRLGVALVAAGILLGLYVGSVVFWRDPVTDVYARYQQHELAGELAEEFETWPQGEYRPAVQLSTSELQQRVAASARRFEHGLQEGHAMGRLEIPRMSTNVVFVEGTDWAHDLSKGPGHYESTSVPGLGLTTAIAGHRTTFGAPFRHIDELRLGDAIRVQLPYGTFFYRVVGHEVVASDDWSIVRKRGFDTLVLSACHPLYSASHRWVVFARLAKVRPASGGEYALAASPSDT